MENTKPPACIINVYWSKKESRYRKVSSKVLSYVPPDALLVVDEIVHGIAIQHGSITLEAADMMLIERVVKLEINNLKGLRLGKRGA